MRYVWFSLAAAVVLVAGCGNNSFDTGNPLANLPSICEADEAPDGCGDFCETASSCGSGTFCQDGLCDAVCTPEGGQCGSAAFCSSSGRCIPLTQEGGTGGTGATGGGTICDSVAVTPTRSIPNVMFLVDQSSSMNEDFGDQSRWQAARDAIVDITADLQSIVRFGLTTYTSRNGNNNAPCPRLPTRVDFALDNATAITDQYPATRPSGNGGDTPTGDSINALVGLITSDPPPSDGPTIIALATDGLPDSCADPNPQNNSDRRATENLAVTAAKNAFDNEGIETFILSVGPDVSDSHLQEMANVGIGLARDTAGPGAATFWKATTANELTAAFEEIIGASISCEIELGGSITEPQGACEEGDVRLDGSPLNCPTDWRLKAGTTDTIELRGTEEGQACARWKSGALSLTAEFPCGTVIVVE